MPSLLPGYEYDVFISYRHNDNQDGWVTDFVQSLERELKVTIKEPLTIYFDKNPHDGLLETHTVGKSLEGKLRCAVFIPILSQTYCDPRSFAWEFEFSAFNKLANADTFGLDVRLANGNVTSRILPIKIHTLDAEDTSMVEKELGGPLRAIEFIYTEPGVNRQLKQTDNRTDNQNKTDYHNQVNKTAQAIKEIIHSLQHPHSVRPSASSESGVRSKPKVKTNYIMSGALVLLTVILVILWPSGPEPKVERSIAVIPFVDMSPEDNEWFAEGLTDEILNSLANLDSLKVTARTSSSYFKGKNIPIPEIAKALGVSNVLEGTVKIVGDRMRITAQLIRASDGFHIWSKTYDREKKDLLAVQVDIAENIGNALLSELSAYAKGKLASSREGNPAAREFFLKGQYLHDHYRTSLKDVDFENAEKELLQAIRMDGKYVGAYAELANLYDTYGSLNDPDKARIKLAMRDSIITLAEKLDSRSPQLLKVKWVVFEQSGQIDSMMPLLSAAYAGMPNDPAILSYLGSLYGFMGLKVQSDKFFARACTLDPLSTMPYPRMADLALKSTHYDTIAWRKVMEAGLVIDPQNNNLRIIKLLQTREPDLAILREVEEYIQQNDMSHSSYLDAIIYAFQGRRAEALRLSRDPIIYYKLGDRDGLLRALDSTQRAEIKDVALWIRPWVYNFAKPDRRFKEIERLGREKRAKFAAKYGGLKWKGLD